MSITNDPRVNTCVDFYLNQDPRRAPAQHFLHFVKTRAKGNRLLDLGCGIGAYSYELQAAGFEVTGVDTNPRYVEIARSVGVDAHCLADGRLPFPNSSFDTVFMLEVLEHIPGESIPGLLEEVRRVTRSNLLVTVPNNTQYDELLRHDFMFGHYQAVDHVQFFTTTTLSDVLGQCFTKVSVEEGDPLYPHRLLPPFVRRPLSALYRLGILKSTLFTRLFAEAHAHA